VDNSVKQCFQAINISRGNVIAQHVTWADTSALRRRGLLGRRDLRSGEGIYLTPCEWLHTFGMQFPIDVAFISKSGRVLAVHHGLKPYRLSKLVVRAEGALELAAGTLHATGTEVGDTVRFLNIPVALSDTR
jgi:hypothetical protein